LLYARLLGSSWQLAAEPVRIAHATGTTLSAHGRLRIEHGRRPVARFVAWLLRLPRATPAAETRLVIVRGADGEDWQRTIGGRPLHSRQYEAGGGELAERVHGVLEFRFRLELAEGVLFFRPVGVALMLGSRRVRLPALLTPEIQAREEPAGARQVRIHVRVALPALGPLIAYDGLIQIEEPRP